jgi:hypothetical protein
VSPVWADLAACVGQIERDLEARDETAEAPAASAIKEVVRGISTLPSTRE